MGEIKWYFHPFKYLEKQYEHPKLKFEVPDYKIYKIDGIPELERVQSELTKYGLKDPWIRNEVWRYPPTYERNPLITARKLLIDGCVKRAFLLTAAIIVAEEYWWKYTGEKPPYVHTLWDWMFHKE